MSTPRWDTSICNCCNTTDDCPFCCMATFCMPIAFGYNTALMRGAKHPCMIQHCGMPYLQFMYLCAIQQFSAAFPQYLGLLSTWVCLTQVSLVRNMLVAVGREKKIYDTTKEFDDVCCCCDEPCCLSFWCMPCVLTRIQHEVKMQQLKNYSYDDSKMVFRLVNSMFEIPRNV